MNFIGKICPYCKTEFKEGDDVVVCASCGTPHHGVCWIANNGCAVGDCSGKVVDSVHYSDKRGKKIFCSNCGLELSEGQKFCASCGAPVKPVGEARSQCTKSHASQAYRQAASAQYRYTEPNQKTGQQDYTGDNGHIQAPSDSDFHSFVQSNQPYYSEKFRKMREANSKTSWNWCSFLFTTPWFIYRKMYSIAAVYIGISIAPSIISSICFDCDNWLLGSFFETVGGIVNLALLICAGIFGNHIYMRYVDNELAFVKNMDDSAKSAYFAKRGGTNTTAVFIAIGVTLVLWLFLYVIE